HLSFSLVSFAAHGVAAHHDLHSFPTRRSSDLGCDAKTIFARAAEGNKQAAELVQRSAQVLARLIADTKAVMDCQRVVIGGSIGRSEEHTSELQSRENLVCRLLLEKKKNTKSAV